MSKKPYRWGTEDAIPDIGTHSLAKHEVLYAYLERYVATLASNPSQDQLRLTIVDGFAGGGIYNNPITRKIHFGSPFQILMAMETAKKTAQSLRKKPFDLKLSIFLIEQHATTLKFLQQALITHADTAGEFARNAQILLGSFESHLPDILQHVRDTGRSQRVIFILDQYGYTDVPMPLLRTIFSKFNNAEVILTFATDWLIDYLNESDECRERLERIGIDSALLSGNSSENPEPPAWRQAVQYVLHQEIHTKSGAKYYTPFFIRSPDAHRCYWLIHLSGHPRARDVMTSLHWERYTHFEHYGRAGLRMLGYDPRSDNDLYEFRRLPFFFDSSARERTVESLIVDLPAMLREHSEGILYSELFAGITNQAPANSEIIKEALEKLSKHGLIEVFRGKKLRTPGARIQESDRIRLPRQKTIIFGAAE